MVKKRKVRKVKSSRRTGRAKSSKIKRVKRRTDNKDFAISNRRKINLVLKNLLIFFTLFLISFLLKNVLNKYEMMESLFSILTIIFLFTSLAFLISFFVLLILRAIRK